MKILSSRDEEKHVGDFLKKIVIGELSKDDIEIYNKFAEKTFFEVNCKTCNRCVKKFNFEDFEKHLTICEEKANAQNVPYISVNRREKNGTSNKELICIKQEKRTNRKKSMDDIRNFDIKQIRDNIKHYFI